MKKFLLFIFALSFLSFLTSAVVGDIIPNNKEFTGNSTIHLTPDRSSGSFEEVVFPEEFWQLNPPPPVPDRTLRIDTIYVVVSDGLQFTGAKAGDPWWDVTLINISLDRQQVAVKIKGSWNPRKQPVRNWYCNSSVVFVNFATTQKKDCFASFYNDGNWTMGFSVRVNEDAAIWQPSDVKLSPQPFVYAVKKTGKTSIAWGLIKSLKEVER